MIKQICSQFRTGILVGEHPYPVEEMEFVLHNQFLLLVDFSELHLRPQSGCGPCRRGEIPGVSQNLPSQKTGGCEGLDGGSRGQAAYIF